MFPGASFGRAVYNNAKETRAEIGHIESAVAVWTLHLGGGLWKCLKIWAERAIAPSGRNELSWDLREDAESNANYRSLAYKVSEESLKVPSRIY